MSKGSVRTLLSAATIAGFWPLAAVAQAPQPQQSQPAQPGDVSVQLPPVQVVGDWLGDGTEKAVRTYPGARTVLSDRALRESGARNLEDAMRQSPGVIVQDETGTGLLPNFGIRGLNPARSERAQVLLDGVPLALAPYTGTGLSLFPVTMQTIDRIDIVRGGAAVRYGPNNVGGVINFISRPIPTAPTYTLSEQLTMADHTGNVLTDTYMRGGGLVTSNLGLQLQLNAIKGAGSRDHSNTAAYNVLFDADWHISDVAQLKGQFQFYQADAQLPGALTPQAYQQNRWQSQRPYDAFGGKTWRGSAAYTHAIGDTAEFGLLLFGHGSSRTFTFSEPFNPAPAPTVVSNSPRTFGVGGVEPRVSWNLAPGGIDQTVTVGARYVREGVDFVVNQYTLRTRATTRQRDWRFDTNAYAAYANDTIRFLDRKLQITAGVRYEYVDTAFRDNITTSASRNISQELLPGLDIGYQATDEIFLFANLHKSLRPPQVAQVTRGGDVGAEVAWNYEAGVRVFPTRGLEISATAFRFDFTAQIEFDRLSQRYLNLGATLHQGFELEAKWQPAFLPGAAFHVAYTFLDTRLQSGQYAGNKVPFASQNLLSLGADYRTGPYSFGATGYYQSSAFTDAANTVAEDLTGTIGQDPGYWLLNLRLARDFELRGGRNITTAFTVNNALDTDYYFRGVDTSPIGRVPGPGRAFMLTLTSNL